MGSVRRLVCSLILVGFSLSLCASVPALNSRAASNRPADVQFEEPKQLRPALTITAAPADTSFYEEFYPMTAARQEQPKTSVLHWFGSLIKKAVRR
jgi:hypothetical protein